MSAEIKKTFKELSGSLMALHKDLLMLEAKLLEADRGKKLTPYELLNATLTDPKLAWLRKLSELIVNIDTIVDETENLSAQESHRVANEVLLIIEKPADGFADDIFWVRYSEYLAHNPDIIMRHSALKQIIDRIKPVM
jgi:hypothetical protein